MPDAQQPKPMTFTPQQLAERLQVCKDTLLKMRADGTGPPFQRIGRAIRYDELGVLAWLEAQRSWAPGEAPGDMARPMMRQSYRDRGRATSRADLEARLRMLQSSLTQRQFQMLLRACGKADKVLPNEGMQPPRNRGRKPSPRRSDAE